MYASLDSGRMRTDWPVARVDPLRPAPDERLVTVYVTTNDRVAGLLARQLESRGVWCSVRAGTSIGSGSEVAVRYAATTVDVPEGERERAEVIMAWFRRPAEGARE
ncbi:MAG: hypothetical protein JWO31_498 [Phycisphaerales bacterium]|nr:hypothetical protein [Phycisphaerales bacterium]